MIKKLENVTLTIFAIGVTIAVLAGGLTLFGYIAAMFIGGETAETICLFIFKQCFPWVIKIASISVGFGLLGMYLGKKESLNIK